MVSIVGLKVVNRVQIRATCCKTKRINILYAVSFTIKLSSFLTKAWPLTNTVQTCPAYLDKQLGFQLLILTML